MRGWIVTWTQQQKQSVLPGVSLQDEVDVESGLAPSAVTASALKSAAARETSKSATVRTTLAQLGIYPQHTTQANVELANRLIRPQVL